MRAATGFKLALASALLGLGALAAAQTTVSGELNASDPTWDRYAAEDHPHCAPDPSEQYYYDVYPIVHDGGTLTVEMRGKDSGSGTLADPYLYLFGGSFDPAQPCTNVVEWDDDSGDADYDSKIEGDFPAGNYVIVATSYDEYDDDDGVGTYQLIHSARPQAPAPGVTAVPTLGEMTLAALSLALAGGGAAALRRRRRGQG